MATATTTGFKITTGWYVFIGVAAGILLSDTVVGPLILGLECVALIYQINQLLKGN